jgi:hypothetical protein
LCSKHVEAWSKYIKKECVKLVINQNIYRSSCKAPVIVVRF